MSKTIKITKKTIPDLLNGDEIRELGYCIVVPDNDSTVEKMHKAVFIYNFLSKKTYDVFIFKRGSSGDFLLSYELESECYLKIKPSDYDFYSKIDKVVNSENSVILKLSSSLRCMAELYCSKKKLAFAYDKIEGTLLVREPGKKSSIYRRIEKEVLTESGIFFAESSVLNLNTARVYCSMLNKESTAKIRCMPVGKDVVIYGRNLSPELECKYEIKHKMYLLNKSIDTEDFNEFLQSLNSNYSFTPEENIYIDNDEQTEKNIDTLDVEIEKKQEFGPDWFDEY